MDPLADQRKPETLGGYRLPERWSSVSSSTLDV
jgi:hypothetical protein